MSNVGGIPEKIKLADGTEISVKENPELYSAFQATMQSARKEEKDKLYNTIASLEASKKVLEDEKKQNGELTKSQKEELDRIKEELGVAKADKKKLEEEIAGKGQEGGKSKDQKKESGEDDVKMSKDEVTKLIQDALAEQKKESDKKIAELSSKLSNKTVGDYRKEQLQKYAGEIIEDLVPENLQTEEEVNSAISKALETSKRYISKEYEVDGKKQRMTVAEYEALKPNEGGEGKQDPPKTPTYDPKTPPTPPPAGGGNVDGKELLSRVEEMTDEEYAKHHDQIMREARSLKYGDN